MSKQEEKEKLLKELKKLAKRANQRLVRLEREYGKDTWASKKLRKRLEVEKLQAFTEKGRIRVSSKYNITQLNAVITATNQFLNSATSSKRGIEKIKKKTKEKFKVIFGVDDENVNDDDVNDIYNLFEDQDFLDVIQKIPSSEFVALLQECKSNNRDKTYYINQLENFIDFGNDLDIKEKALRIYENLY